MGDCDRRTKLYGAGFGGIYEHVVSLCGVGLDVDVEGENSKGRLGREVQPELEPRDERSAEPEKGPCRGERDIGLWLY